MERYASVTGTNALRKPANTHEQPPLVCRIPQRKPPSPYLRKDIKEIINSIVDELGKDEHIAALYDLWYESKETALKVYTESRPERLPLSQNKEFKSVKNMVIAEAMKLNLPTDEVEETDEPTEPDREPTAEEAESPDPPPPPMDEYEKTVADADKGNKWSQYRAAKFMLDRDGDHYDPKKAVEYLTRSAKQGYTVAKYMLGKLYLRGEDVPKQMLHALHWLESAVKDDNQYAEYLLGKTFLKGEDIERDTERAESLLRRSAEQGNKYAAYTLGKAYLDGDVLAQSIDEAVRLLNLSASKGFAPAQFILGRLLYKGEVVPKDIKKCKHFLGYNKNADGEIEIVPEEAEIIREIYERYLSGESLHGIKCYLEEKEIPTPAGCSVWRQETIRSILSNEKYKGDAIINKTYVSDCISKRIKANNGERNKYYIENNHPAIIDAGTFARAQEEIARRSGKPKVKQKGTKTELSRYSSRYALSELLICGECRTPYRRCTWTAKGKRKIVWRCINRLDYGKKYCHHSPSIEESLLQDAVMRAIMQTAKQNIEVLKTLKIHIGMGLTDEVTEDKTLDIQIRIAEIAAEFQKMLKAVSADNADGIDEERITELMNEKQRLTVQLEQYSSFNLSNSNHYILPSEIIIAHTL